MILTLDDMPYGWSGSIKGREGDYLISSFRNVEGFMPKTLRCEVAKYDSIELAQNEYNRLKEEHKNTKLKPFNAGNEGFIFTVLYREQIVFRKGNVVAIFDGVYNSHEKFAKIVDKKIDPTLNENIIISPTITPAQTSTQIPTQTSNDVYTLKEGESLDIGKGYAIIVLQLDIVGTNVWIELLQNGYPVSDRVMNTDKQSTWIIDDVAIIEIISINLPDNSVNVSVY